MDNVLILLNQVAIMFLLILTGFVCYRLKLISREANKQLSNLVITIVNSAMMLKTFQSDYSPTLLRNLGIILILSFAMLIIADLVSNLMRIGSSSSSTLATERFAIIFTNSGYMGIPLLVATIGSNGLFYASSFLIAFNIYTWTKGVMLLTGKSDKKLFLTAFTSPVMISIFIGIPMFLLQIKFPETISSAIDYLADLFTPLSMIVSGCFIAQNSLRKAFTQPRVYINSGIRLILVPLIMLVILTVIPLDNDIRLSILILASAPTAASTMLFSSRFGGDIKIAGSLFSLSTILCIITIPVLTMISSLIW